MKKSFKTSALYWAAGGFILGLAELVIGLPLYSWVWPEIYKYALGPVYYFLLGAAGGIIFSLIVYLWEKFANKKIEKNVCSASVNITFILFVWSLVWTHNAFNFFSADFAGIKALVLSHILGLLFISCLMGRVSYRILHKRKDRLFPSFAVFSFLLYLSIAALFYLYSRPAVKEPSAAEIKFSKTAGSKKPNIVLITPDALRADHLSCYGYAGIKTPAIDSIAEEGVLFKDTYSAAPWTAPSFASLFTSRYPLTHNCRKKGTGKISGINNKIPTLAEILKEAGYKTQAFTDNVFLSGGFGFERGFDRYINLENGSYSFLEKEEYKRRENLLNEKRRAFLWNIILPDIERRRYSKNQTAAVTERALRWLDTNSGSPFFLWVHYYDPHSPYDRFKNYNLFPEYKGKMTDEAIRKINPPDVELDLLMLNKEDKKKIKACYDEEILLLDENIGSILNKLRKLNIMDNTIIIFTSDHGEELWDHGRAGHGHSLYNELTKVPLIFRYPEKIPSNLVIKNQAGNIDIMPTVLELIGISEKFNMDGASLLPVIQGGGAWERAVYSEALLYEEERISIVKDGYKFIYWPSSNISELYDLNKDPFEKNNLIGQEEKIAAILEENLMKWRKDCEANAAALDCGEENSNVKFNSESLKRLQSLGYIQ